VGAGEPTFSFSAPGGLGEAPGTAIRWAPGARPTPHSRVVVEEGGPVDRRERIRERAEAIAASEGVELVDLHYRREGPGWVLRLFIDKPGGVALEDCQEISQQLGAQVEVEDLVPHRYTLEVSSPGLDRPLLKEADYTRFAGRSVRITTDRPLEGRRRFRGRLEGLTDGQVLLTTDEGERFELPLERVASARLEIEF